MLICDGGCSGNGNESNLGGWGAVLVYGPHVKELYGGATSTTNNIMELTAAIEGLSALKSTDLEIEIFSDSAYVVNCFKEKWYIKWQMNGWVNAKKEPVENQALWETLISRVQTFNKVAFYKIKGHLNVDKPADVRKWFEKFNKDNKLQYSLEDFLKIVEYNHLADALANKGIDENRVS
ncbi:MAG: ribonuclease [Clostridiales bacterium]|jgi:ribonuclease HI|nr:ribonuclease [Clostridiales bacterium]MDN5300268.1 ribonuclease [Clostridiales bacterium]